MTWIEIIGLLLSTGTLSALVTWLTTRHLKKAEAGKADAQAADFLSTAYSKLIKNLNTEVENLRAINKEMTESKDRLLQQIKELEDEVERLRKTVVKLTNRLTKYENDRKEEA